MAARSGATRTLAAIPNLDALFNARVRRGVSGALAEERGAVVFASPPVGSWTVRFDMGRVRLQRGSVSRPRAVVRADPPTLAAVLDGRISGIEAFLDHGLTVRGDLAFALQMDGAFDVGSRPAHHPTSKLVETLGIRVAYLEAGPADAPVVLLLHGLGATNASMLPLVVDLAQDHRVIAPDFPGFGASQAPLWRYSAAELGRWLDEFMRVLGIEHTDIVGNSLGGRVALEAALVAPSSVDRLVLLCPSPAFLRWRQFVPLVRALPPTASIGLPALPHRLVVAGIRSMFADPDRLSRPWYDAAADEHRRVMADFRHRRAFYAALREIYLEPAHGDDGFWERLPRLRSPALFVWGDHDRLVPSRFARHVTDAVPHCESVVLADSGHVPQFEHPGLTLSLIRDFIDG
jgi:pimeloyl-ACP methyl ester carboxylesterase